MALTDPEPPLLSDLHTSPRVRARVRRLVEAHAEAHDWTVGEQNDVLTMLDVK